jgi:chromosome segregation ATPase
MALGAARCIAAQLDQQLREASGRAETERSQRAQAERQLAELRLQMGAAQAKAAEAEALPEMRQELSASGAEVARLLQREQRLEGEGVQLREQLAAAQAASAAAAAQAAEQQRMMDDLAASNAVVQQQLRKELQRLKVRSGPRVVWAGHPCAQAAAAAAVESHICIYA